MIVHLNGQLVPAQEAKIGVFDRGFIFGDSVYEGLRSFEGRVVALDRHVARMRSALRETRMDWDPAQMGPLSDALLRANRMEHAFVYWHVSRGTPLDGQPVRSRVPAGPIPPTIFGYCSPQPPMAKFDEGPATVTGAVRPDTRWTRGHLKSCSLMGNVIAAIETAEAGALETILVRDGLVSEASASNVLLALPRKGGQAEIATPSLESVSILGGITRALLIDEFPEIACRSVRVEELARASEVMVCGSTSMVTSVVMLDGRPVGDGKPGPVARRLLAGLVAGIRRDLRLSGPSAKPMADTGPIRVSPTARDILNRCTSSQAVA